MKKNLLKKTERDGGDSKLNLQCLEYNKSVNTTNINHFVNHGALGCKCTKYKSEKCLGKLDQIGLRIKKVINLN